MALGEKDVATVDKAPKVGHASFRNSSLFFLAGEWARSKEGSLHFENSLEGLPVLQALTSSRSELLRGGSCQMEKAVPLGRTGTVPPQSRKTFASAEFLLNVFHNGRGSQEESCIKEKNVYILPEKGIWK